MALNIKNPEAHRLAHELAEATGGSLTEAVTDEAHKIVTTPAYMLATGPAEVYEGIRKLVNEVLRLS